MNYRTPLSRYSGPWSLKLALLATLVGFLTSLPLSLAWAEAPSPPESDPTPAPQPNPNPAPDPEPTPPPRPCNDVATCGSAAPCTPDASCNIGTCNGPCENFRVFKCSANEKWELQTEVVSICGTLCGEDAALHVAFRTYTWIDHPLAGRMPVMIYESIEQNKEFPEDVVHCTDDARPPVTTDTTLACMVESRTDEKSNQNGIDTPGTKHEWEIKKVDEDKNCPDPYRKMKEPPEKGCTIDGRPCPRGGGDDDDNGDDPAEPA